MKETKTKSFKQGLAKKFKVFLFMFSLAQIFFVYAQPIPAQASLIDSLKKGQICEPVQTLTDANGKPTDTDASTNLARCVNNIYVFSIAIGGFVGVLMFVFAGYLYTFGTAESVKQAKSIIVSTIAGLILLFGAYAFLNTIGGSSLTSLQNMNTLPAIFCQDNSCAFDANTSNPLLNINPQAAEQATGVKGASGIPASEIIKSGCVFDSSKQSNEAPGLVLDMFHLVEQVCNTASKTATPIRISSVIGLGSHATNSLHYVGCAVDFGNDIGTAQGNAIIAAAKSLGFDTGRNLLTDSYRINPGTDAERTDMIHIDLGAKCPNLKK